jgi:hypothetical protein
MRSASSPAATSSDTPCSTCTASSPLPYVFFTSTARSSTGRFSGAGDGAGESIT